MGNMLLYGNNTYYIRRRENDNSRRTVYAWCVQQAQPSNDCRARGAHGTQVLLGLTVDCI